MNTYDNHHFHFEDIDPNCTGTDILEFGVYSGQSLLSILKKCKQEEIKVRRVYGFDGFDGLPLDERDKDLPNHEDWVEGAFNAKDLFGVHCLEHVVEKLDELFKPTGFDVEFIPIDFNQLGDWIFPYYDIKPAFYINVDCDLYSSAKDVLNFIFENDFLAVGGLIRYDDWNGAPNGGEELAHNETVKQFGLRFQSVGHCVFKYLGRL